jgi:hypothetical protein
MRRRLLPLLLTPLLVGGACAGQGEEITDPWYVGYAPMASYEPDDVVLRVAHFGGLAPVEVHATRIPVVTVYGDGRVVYLGPQDQSYGSSVLANLRARTITDDAVGDLVELALRAGVGYRDRYDNPTLMDAPSTRLTILTSDGELTTTVYGLGIDGRFSDDERAERQRLAELVDQLADLPTMLGVDAAGEEQPYEPAAVAAITSPYVEDADAPRPELAWPGPALPGDPLGTYPGLSCLTVTGAELAPVLDAAQEAELLTPWTSGDQRYFVWFRPLLPDESTCADLD